MEVNGLLGRLLLVSVAGMVGVTGAAACGETEVGGGADARESAGAGGSAEPMAAACPPGDTRTCVGPGACRGGQICLDDGWSSCDCGSENTGSGGAGDANGGEPPGGGSGGVASQGDGGADQSAGAGGADPCPGVTRVFTYQVSDWAAIDPPWHGLAYRLDMPPTDCRPQILQCVPFMYEHELMLWTEEPNPPPWETHVHYKKSCF